MRLLLTAAVLATACLALSGCITAQIAKDPAGTITALSNAGCAGTLKVGAHVATASGVSAGAASGDVDFSGTCDPAKRPAVAQTAPPS